MPIADKILGFHDKLVRSCDALSLTFVSFGYVIFAATRLVSSDQPLLPASQVAGYVGAITYIVGIALMMIPLTTALRVVADGTFESLLAGAKHFLFEMFTRSAIVILSMGALVVITLMPYLWMFVVTLLFSLVGGYGISWARRMWRGDAAETAA